MHLADKPMGYLGSVLVGVAFGAGWTPCLGPILGAILTYTAADADLSRGLPLLLAYSLGLAIPFLLAAVAVERFIVAVRRFRPYMAPRVAGERRAPDRRRAADDVRLLHRHRRLAPVTHARRAAIAALRIQSRCQPARARARVGIFPPGPVAGLHDEG